MHLHKQSRPGQVDPSTADLVMAEVPDGRMLLTHFNIVYVSYYAQLLIAKV